MMATKRTSFVDLLPPASGSSDRPGGEQAGPPPTTALLHTVVGNPANPRDAADYTTANDEFREMQETFRTVGQLQPIVVVSRAVYVRHHPEHADAVAAADWVVVMGNRRLAVARSLGWTKVDVRVQDRLGDGDGTIREAVVIENGQRSALDPCKEAVYLSDLVRKYGSQEAVAEKIGKSQMYVSNRIALLGLAPELRDLTDRRKIRIKVAEQLSKLPTFDEQRAAWQEEQRSAAADAEERKRARAERKSQTAAPRGGSADVLAQNPVLKSGAEPPTGSELDAAAAAVQNPVLKPAAPAAQAAPESAPVFTAVKTAEHREAPAVPPQAAEEDLRPPAPDAAPDRPERAAVLVPSPAHPVPAWVEPAWAVGKVSSALAAARRLVEEFGPDDRRTIVRYLAGLEEAERTEGKTEGIVHKR